MEGEFKANAKMHVIWEEDEKVKGSELKQLKMNGSWLMATNFDDDTDYAPPKGCCFVSIHYIAEEFNAELRESTARVIVGLNCLGSSPDEISPFLKRIQSYVSLKQAASLFKVRAAGAEQCQKR